MELYSNFRWRLDSALRATLTLRLVRSNEPTYLLKVKSTAKGPGHHLNLAGRSDALFSDDAIPLIHQTARGIPRAVKTSPSRPW
jgi:hypothetical protein